MKIIILILSSVLAVQTSIYSFSLDLINGKTISLSTYREKRIIIAPFNGNNVDRSLLRRLDSLQHKHADSLVVIAVPALEFGANVSVQNLQKISDSMALSFMISQPVQVKKIAGTAQHVLFKWLSTVSENTHFDRDAEAEGQLFIISKKGTLYGILHKEVPAVVLQRVLSQEVKE